MSYGLDLEKLPVYCHSAYRHFVKNEKHITRVCSDDVLIFMLEGQLSFVEAGEKKVIEEGEYYIQQSGLLQEGDRLCGGARYYYVHFHGAFGDSPSALPVRGPIDKEKLLPYFEKLEELKKRNCTAVETNAHFYALLSALCPEEKPTVQKKAILKVKELVEKDLEKSYSLEELAQVCSYSKNNLIRIFKEQTGMPPHAFVTTLRLAKAKELLEHSEEDVGQIALCCGFGSYINFYKHFKSAEGCNPKDWRRKRRGM